MALPVRLKHVVDSLESVDDQLTAHLNLKTGEIVEVIQPEFGDEPDPMAEEVCSENFVALPTKFQIHEWEIMRRFAQSQTNDEDREDLLDANHGRGAFRHFKSITSRRGLREQWYQFRHQALEEIAIEFLEENEIPYIVD